MAPRIFGNTLASMRGSFIVLGILALALWVALYMLDRVHDAWSDRLLVSALRALLIAGIPLVVILPSFLFKLRFGTDTVSHMLLGITLSRMPMDKLRSVELAAGWGAVLTFADGSRIRYLRAALDALWQMCRYIESTRPGQVSFSVGAAAALLAVSDKFKRDA